MPLWRQLRRQAVPSLQDLSWYLAQVAGYIGTIWEARWPILWWGAGRGVLLLVMAVGLFFHVAQRPAALVERAARCLFSVAAIMGVSIDCGSQSECVPGTLAYAWGD